MRMPKLPNFWAMRLAVVPMMVLLTAVAAVAAVAGAAGADGGRFPLSVAPPSVTLPATLSATGRHLIDATGQPFLLNGDTAWSLIADLNREDAELYLKDRAARGFNTILVSLIEHKYATNAPANAYREPPFLAAGDYARPNETYFAHADWVLRRARDLGILVLLTPSYMGYGGGEEGWYREMKANGPDKLRDYGRYLGRRYKDFDNIIWVHGGDYDPPDKRLATAIVEGIREFDRRVLHTAHGNPESPVSEYWSGEPWLALDNIYTYGPVHEAALQQYARGTGRPFFLIETTYENEHDVSEQALRAQAYGALLGGASGQIFGNNPIWHFDARGLYSAPTDWKHALDSSGSRDMAHLHALFDSLPWWRLKPVANGLVQVRGHEPGIQRAAAAITTDGELAILYIPSARTVSVGLDRLRGRQVSARWYDPTSGRFIDEGSPRSNAGQAEFTVPGRNGRGQDDWILIVESESGSQKRPDHDRTN
jgi:hypothetical protein